MSLYIALWVFWALFTACLILEIIYFKRKGVKLFGNSKSDADSPTKRKRNVL